MKHTRLGLIRLALWSLTCVPWIAQSAPVSVHEHRSVNPQSVVDLTAVSGALEVQGWDKAEIDVSGTLGVDAERLDIAQNAGDVAIRVVAKSGTVHGRWNWNWIWPGSSNNAADRSHLVIKVPRGAALKAHLTSADLAVSDLGGDQELQSVSGALRVTSVGDVRLRTVSGDIQLAAAPSSRVVQITTVSGDTSITGAATGEVSIESVSGDVHVHAGTLHRATFQTVSGDVQGAFGLVADGRVTAESVSSDVRLHFAGQWPPAEYDLSSLSGAVSTCTGRQATRDGSGHRLSFREAAATGRIHVTTKSGNVALCDR
jgi:DUF4097 and DUF4098 domain-containing protein YvlB